MRYVVLLVLGFLAAAAPTAAQLNTHYQGVQRESGKESPATAQFSVEKGRVALIMKGSRASRMLFLEKQELLRVVDDVDRNYFDIGKNFTGGMGSGSAGLMEEAQEQLAQLPPEQRQMAEQMMEGALGSVKTPPPSVYAWSKEKRTIKGYECTRVDVMEGDVKKAEYWGTTSADFKMSDAERNTMLAMQGYLRNFLIMVSASGGGTGLEPASGTPAWMAIRSSPAASRATK